jgi:hypothetical protein
MVGRGVRQDVAFTDGLTLVFLRDETYRGEIVTRHYSARLLDRETKTYLTPAYPNVCPDLLAEPQVFDDVLEEFIGPPGQWPLFLRITEQVVQLEFHERAGVAHASAFHGALRALAS